MRIEPLKAKQSANAIICDSFLVSKFTSIEALIEIYEKLSLEHKGCVLLTLDDLAQAEYTSAHSIESHDLDDTDGYDLSSVSPSAFEDGEHIGSLSTTSEFFIRKGNFDKQVINYDDVSLAAKDISLDEDELEKLIDVNLNPLSWIDNYVIAKIVPVAHAYEMICAFPNGYFSCDLNPFENYSLAKRLEEKYNYRLFGVGASLLGFIRTDKLSGKLYDELINDLSTLYAQPETKIAKIIHSGKKYNLLFLKYTESLD